MTLGHMRRMVEAGARDAEVRAAAIDALQRAGAASHNATSQLAALFRFVRDQIFFVADPIGIQVVQSPRYTLERGAGNCTQRAVLLAALARSVGIPTDLRFRAIAANPRFPRTFSHVYVVATVGGRPIPLDPTYRNNEPGFEYPGALRTGDFAL